MKAIAEILIILLVAGAFIRYNAAEIYLWWLEFDKKLEKWAEDEEDSDL